MNKIKNIVFGLCLLVTSIYIVSLNEKQVYGTSSVFDGWHYTEVSLATGTIFTGAGRVKKVFASSDTTLGANFAFLADTVTASDPAIASFDETRRRSPVFQFPVSTVTASGSSGQGIWTVVDYGEDGVIFTSACYVWKTAAASGQALRVGVLWRK